MNLIHNSIRQPVTVAVGVILLLLMGVVALRRIPIQLTPNVEDTIVAVSTRWEGASPEEIEQEIVDPQEEQLQGIANLKEMTSTSLQGSASVRLEFAVGISKDEALREVSDKLRQVQRYPDNVDEPVIEASDPRNRDYIAWIMFQTSDPDLDIRTLQDFAKDRIQPTLERVEGVSDVNVLGGREREAQVRFDPRSLAGHGLSISQLVQALRAANRNISGGLVVENKLDVRLRLVNQFSDLRQIEETVVAQTDSGPVRVLDVAEVVLDFKEADSFVHSKGRAMIAINVQKEVGVNVMEVMDGLKLAIAGMNAPGGLLDAHAQSLGLHGTLSLEQSYDQTIYIDDALLLVKNNIWIGGGLAILVLLLFLRSLRSSGIIALAIPISMVGAVSAMIFLGRTVNVISLAGMAFAIGMVVDNAIVVLENIYRHLEKGKGPFEAALDGAREVLGAVVAATLTTVVVFIPILLIEDEAGQLFRDIAMAIVAAVFLSLVVSVTVIPTCAARLLKSQGRQATEAASGRRGIPILSRIPDWIGNFTYWIGGSLLARLALVTVLTAASVAGTLYLIPPADYLPQGNRNLVFGMLIPPPGYNLDQSGRLAERMEETVRPFWEAGEFPRGSAEYAKARAALPEIPTMDPATHIPGEPVVPPPLENYFIVSFPGTMFHGGISCEPEHVIDHLALFAQATRAEQTPGVLAFAFQVPLFRLGGATGSAVQVNFSGDDLEQVSSAATAVFLEMMDQFGPETVQPSPSNFNLPGPELQVIPRLVRLSEVGMTSEDLGLAVQALGDGSIIGEYRIGGQTVDLRVMALDSRTRSTADTIGEAPIATPAGGVVPLATLGQLQRVTSAPQINRIGRRRSVSLQFTPPPGLPLEEAIGKVEALLASHRSTGAIPPTVVTSYTGSASKLASVQQAMFGDGSLVGVLGSAMVLALLVVYLLMCVLFQSFLLPMIIMFSVPLATLGGFAALQAVHTWTLGNRYMPVQSLDILTLLGFVILIGVVVNNAILIVHQSRNFMLGGDEAAMEPRRAIAEAVRSRVRPIFMGTLTSVGGMAPLVLMSGSGSELYRGLGSVVVGGLMVSTIFTLFLVPSLLSLLTQLQGRLGWLDSEIDPVQRQVGSPTPVGIGGAAAVGLLLLSLFFLNGCTSEPGLRSAPMQTLLHDVVEDQIADVGSQAAPEAPMGSATPAQDDRLSEALASRLEELEATGGPASYRDLELHLPPTLDGAARKLQQVDLLWAVSLAARNNLAIQLSQELVAGDHEGFQAAEAFFDPALFADLQLDRSDQPRIVPSINGIPLGAQSSRSNAATAQVGSRKQLTGGGSLQASTSLRWSDNRTPGIALVPDPAYLADLQVSVLQPLLRGRGSEVTQADQTLQRNQEQRAQVSLREDLTHVLENAEVAYLDLQLAWKNLAIREQLTERGAEVERVLRERQSFDANPAEYSDALATLETRRANLVRAGQLVAEASDRLKDIVNDPNTPLVSEDLLMPTGELEAEPFDRELKDLMRIALQQRPEVESAMLAIDDAQLRQRVASNLRQPQLDLRAGASVSGLDEQAGTSYESLVSDDHYTFFLGLSFDVPVGNRAAVARERQAMHENRASVLRYEQVVRSVLLEVKQALRQVRTNATLVVASKNVRLAQTENLRALVAEQEQRSSLSPEFLNLLFGRQEGLANAQLGEMLALADYNRALAGLRRVLGAGVRSDQLELTEYEYGVRLDLAPS